MKKMALTVSLLAMFYGLCNGRTAQGQSSRASMYESSDWFRGPQWSVIPRLGDIQPGTQTPEQIRLEQLPESMLDLELKSVNGKRFKLSDYSGRVLVLNLWATWCGPCRFETPMLVKLQKKFRSQGVRVVALSTEHPKASYRSVRRWVRKYGVNYRVGWLPAEMAVTLMQGRDAVPQGFVISGQGRIIKRFVGFNQSSTPSLMKGAIKEALKATNP